MQLHATSILVLPPCNEQGVDEGRRGEVLDGKVAGEGGSVRPFSLGIRSQPRTQSSDPVLLHFATLGFGTPDCTAIVAAPSAPAATP